MPNQLAKSKRRQSLAEHQAVLAALASIARIEDTTVMALLREGARSVVRRRMAIPAQTNALRSLIRKMGPRMPARFDTAAQVARFKRVQREFDQVVMDIQIEPPVAIQDRNSIISSRQAVRVIDFDLAHVAAPR